MVGSHCAGCNPRASLPSREEGRRALAAGTIRSASHAKGVEFSSVLTAHTMDWSMKAAGRSSGTRRAGFQFRGADGGLEIGAETNEPLWDGSALDYDVAVSGLVAGAKACASP
jgi:hypothetical protein